MKKTKIVCTMGPQEENIELVKQLIEAGMDVARFNFSHGTHEEQLARMNVIRQAREETGKPIAMLLDTKGPEIRTGLLKDGQKVELVTGNDIILTCEECVGTAERVSISYKDLLWNLRSSKSTGRISSAGSKTAACSPRKRDAMFPV